MSLRLVRRLGAFLAGHRTAPGTVAGSIWKNGEEYVLVRRSEWEALKRENAELRRQLAQALAVIEELKAENAALKARVAELEEKLRTSSSNSSKPPSSDPPWAKQKPKRKKGKRKRGGQKGHEGKARELLPPEEVDTCRCRTLTMRGWLPETGHCVRWGSSRRGGRCHGYTSFEGFQRESGEGSEVQRGREAEGVEACG